MNPLDSGPGSGGGIIGVLLLALTIALEWIKRGNRKRQEAAKSIPPTKGHALPPPAADRALLARLDRAEQHDAIVSALLRTQAELVDRDKHLRVLRDECSRLALRVHALEGDVARKDVQLRAERLSTQVLREQLAHVEGELAAAKGEYEVLAADLRRALLVRG